MDISCEICWFFYFVVMFALFSPSAFGLSNSHLAPLNLGNVSSNLLEGNLDNQGYEVRRVSYQSVGGLSVSKELILITTSAGAWSAYNNVGLSYDTLQDLLQDFNSPLTFSQRASSAAGSAIASVDMSSGMLIIIDVEAEAITSQAQADAYIARWGLEIDPGEDNFFDAETLSSEYGTSCPRQWKCRTRNYQNNNINHSVNRTETLTQNNYGSVSLDIIGHAKAEAAAKIDYRYKRKWKIPYKVKVDFIDSNLKYDFQGNLRLHGKADRTFAGREFELFQAKVYDNFFMVGAIPVQVDIKTYVRFGTGDLILSAAGELGAYKPLRLKGEFSYVCDNQNCIKQSESFNNFDESLSVGNIAYQVIASAKIEPYLNAAIRGRLYWGSIYAEVGLQPSIPLELFGYAGNLCGDGLNGNEHVQAGLLKADLRAGVTWKTRFITYTPDRNYKQFYRTPLGYKDLLNPSTALSPIIRPVVSGSTVNLTTALRSCVTSVLDKKFQNFTIFWGDNSQLSLNDVTGSVTSSKTFSSAGTYNIRVQHANGAFTDRSIVISTGSSDGGPGRGSDGGSGTVVITDPP